MLMFHIKTVDLFTGSNYKKNLTSLISEYFTDIHVHIVVLLCKYQIKITENNSYTSLIDLHFLRPDMFQT